MKQIYKTKQDCLLPALECLSKSEFAKKFPGAVAKAQKEGWYKEITSHLKHPKIKWTKESAQEVAKKYKTKTEFNRNDCGCYSTAYNNKWLDDICAHMIPPTKPRNFYTKEKCKELALTCKSRKDFRERFDSAYQQAYKKKWLDEICKHMLPLNDKRFRDIYIIKNEKSRFVYVGLSCNVQKRYNHHLSKPSAKMKELLSMKHELEILEKHLPTEIAVQKEQEYVDKFRQNGWTIMNSVKTGSIGNPYQSKWNVDKIKEIASSFTYRMDFYRAYPGVYDFLYEKKLLEEVCSHMKSRITPRTIEINNESLTFTEASIKYNKARACIVKRWLSGKKDLDLIN